MRILHCLESLDPAAGGPARSVPQLAMAQARLGHEVGLWQAANIQHGTAGVDRPEGEEDVGPIAPGKGAVTLQQLCGPFAEALQVFGKIDIVHDHGIWLPFHKEIAKECARLGIPRIVSPRGMLEPWAMNHKKWKKRLAWWLYQRRDLHRAAALHATAESEAAQLRKLGFKQRIIVAANGVGVEGTSNIEHPTSNVEFHVGRVGFNARNSSTIHDPQSTVCNPVRTALFLSRIHPKKGLPLLLEVWARLRPQGWQLRIVGPDEGGHLAELKRLCEKLGLEWEDEANIEHRRGDEGDSLASTPTERRYKAEQVTDPFNIQHSKFNILFSGPLDGEEKWRAYRAADLFVLPTYSENFGIAVAEALACSVPVITTTGAPWAGLLDRRCGWWVAPEVDEIGRALEEAIGMNDAEREAMGGRGAVWVREDFVWEGIARRVIDGYGEILNVG